MKIFAYRRNDVSVDFFSDALRDMGINEPSFVLFTDSDRDVPVYHQMKEELEQVDDGMVLIQNLQQIGEDSQAQAVELKWFLDRSMALVILCYPVMVKYFSKKVNTLFLTLLYEYLSSGSGRRVIFMEPRVGRRKIVYPENWDILYRLWRDKKITARDFMKKAHVKRGTFYHMVAEYEIQLDKRKVISLAH